MKVKKKIIAPYIHAFQIDKSGLEILISIGALTRL